MVEDTEEIIIKKEAVKQARREMSQLLKEGHSVLEVLLRQRDSNEHEKELHLTIKSEIHKMRKEGASQADIIDYLEKSNKFLEQNGIAPTSLPERKHKRQ